MNQTACPEATLENGLLERRSIVQLASDHTKQKANSVIDDPCSSLHKS